MGTQLPSPKGAGSGAPKFSAHIYCGQTAGWINMTLGMEVGLSPGDFMLYAGPSPLPKKGGAPIFGSCLLRPNASTWIKMPLGMEVNLGPGDLVLDGDPAPPSPKRKRSPNFSAHIYCMWPNGWMDQDGTWHGRRPQSRRLYVIHGTQPLPQKGAEPQFSAHVYCGQTCLY